MTSNFFSYTYNIYAARFFWAHLALADLRAKYRRSTLGLVWAILQPLMMTLLLSFVMGAIFHVDVKNYAPYIFSGLILWEFVIASTVSGCSSFINAEAYIKQFSHPLLIYSLRAVLTSFINLLAAFVGLLVWVLFWKPSNFNFSLCSLLPSFALLFLFAWSLSSLCGFIGTRFRDFSQLIVIVLQAVWYSSPVYFLPDIFRHAHLDFLVDNNPIYHLLNLIRAPMLYGQWPPLESYLYTIGVASVLWMITVVTVGRLERKVIYYL